jgi:hypothetical protein
MLAALGWVVAELFDGRLAAATGAPDLLVRHSCYCTNAACVYSIENVSYAHVIQLYINAIKKICIHQYIYFRSMAELFDGRLAAAAAPDLLVRLCFINR